jgi:hypothetical protein
LSNNFGDALVPWMVRELTGTLPIFAAPADGGAILGGSVANHAVEGTVIWGAGVASMRDEIHERADIRGLRGPISRCRATACGASVPASVPLGDAALLLPRLREWLTSLRRVRLGVVPHYMDQQRTWAALRDAPDVRLVNVFDSIEDVVEQIISCDLVLSSSLHGLVVAHAFGIPALWARVSDSIGGDGTKFRDHLMSIGLEVYDPLDLRTAWPSVQDLISAVEQTEVPQGVVLRGVQDALRAAWPL